MSHLIEPHGGEIRNLMLTSEEVQEIKLSSFHYPSTTLSPRQICDLELLISGGFSPLEGFLVQADYERVLKEMRLADGTFWPLPVMLDIPEELAGKLGRGDRLALRDPEGTMVAVLEVDIVWAYEAREEAEVIFGKTGPDHPGVGALMAQHAYYAGGRVLGVEKIGHYDFKRLRKTPSELRAEFSSEGWRQIAGYHTPHPMHRLQREMTIQVAENFGCNLLVHPAVGLMKPDDINHYARVRSYQALSHHYPPGIMKMSLINLATRWAGPRETLWNAIVRKNHGCSHFIFDPDHVEPGNGFDPQSHVPSPEVQGLFAKNEKDIAIELISLQEMAYVPNRGKFFPVSEIGTEPREENISGAEFRRRLRLGLNLPDWFSYVEVIDELKRAHPPREKQGFTLFFTGLSGSGKSTLAKIMVGRLMELGTRPVTLLDGDIVRQNLSSELGFSHEHRNLNILRIGYVANEISKNGGVAICAPIAPYEETRQNVRRLISEFGGFIEIHLATPVEVCEQRDHKGLYAKARAGIIPNFTGISDPYETPTHPEIKIDTSDFTPEEAAQEIWLFLEREGFLS